MKNSSESIVSLNKVWLVLESQAGPVEILRGVDLDVKAGESVCISGPSGAGKTSLMMIIGGLERATRGDAVVAGHDLGRLNEDTLAKYRRDRIGIVFQSFHLIPTMTALENAALPLELAGESDAVDRAQQALAYVGLEQRWHHYPSQLSGGEQQRVAIVRALISQPDLILADEPTGNLDATNSVKLMNLLFDLCGESGATLLLITHQSDLASRCERQVKMSDGRIIVPADAPVLT